MKSHNLIYYTGLAITDFTYVEIYSVNPLNLIFNKVN